MNVWAFLGTTVGAVLAVAIPFVRSYMQTNFTPQKFSTVMNLAHVAVSAAEKYGNDHALAGADKLTLAADALVENAKHLGLKLKEDEVLSFIHSALAMQEQMPVVNPVVAAG